MNENIDRLVMIAGDPVTSCVKQLMLNDWHNVVENTEHKIFIIDPSGEWSKTVESAGGKVVKVGAPFEPINIMDYFTETKFTEEVFHRVQDRKLDFILSVLSFVANRKLHVEECSVLMDAYKKMVVCDEEITLDNLYNKVKVISEVIKTPCAAPCDGLIETINELRTMSCFAKPTHSNFALNNSRIYSFDISGASPDCRDIAYFLALHIIETVVYYAEPSYNQQVDLYFLEPLCYMNNTEMEAYFDGFCRKLRPFNCRLVYTTSSIESVISKRVSIGLWDTTLFMGKVCLLKPSIEDWHFLCAEEIISEELLDKIIPYSTMAVSTPRETYQCFGKWGIYWTIQKY